MKQLILKIIYTIVKGWQIFYAKILYMLRGIDEVSHYLKALSSPVHVMRAFGATIGARTVIFPGIILHGAKENYSNLVVGNDCRIGRGVLFDLTDKVTVEDTVNLAMRTIVLTHVNISRSPIRHLGYEPKSAPVTFKMGAVTFAGAKVLMGVELAECSVLGAGCVMSTNTKPYGVYVGNPGRLVKSLKDFIEKTEPED